MRLAPSLPTALTTALLLGCGLLSAQPDLAKPLSHYNETLNGATATLDYRSSPSRFTFDVTVPGNAIPSLDVQARLLDVLLGRLLKDYPNAANFGIRLGANREALIEPLQRYLLSSPDWDAVRGLPKPGRGRGRRLGEWLTDALNEGAILASLDKVCAAHGFGFVASGMNGIDIQKIPAMRGARLPLHIADIAFSAGKFEEHPPSTRYSETSGDATATLDYWQYSQPPSTLLFDVRLPGEATPPLELQGRLLETLLGRALKDHPEATELFVLLGGNRQALIEPLGRILVSSREWDSARGLPRNGRLGDLLIDAVNRSGMLGPLVKAFDAHAFTFELRSVNRIDIQKIPAMHGARLPLYITEMDFIANKKK
jgi:hypothetical protein